MSETRATQTAPATIPSASPVAGVSAGLPPKSGELSRGQKAAIVIALLGPENAAPVIANMDNALLQKYITIFSSLKTIPREDLVRTAEEFIVELRGSLGSMSGDKEAAENLLTEALDEDKIMALLGKAPEEVQDTESAWDRITDAKTDELAKWLAQQRIAFTVVVLSRLSPEKTGEVMAELSDDIAQKVIMRLAKPLTIDEETISIIGQVIQQDFLNNADKADPGSGAIDLVTEIMNYLPPNKRDALVDFVEEKEPETAKAIRDNLLTFEDLPVRLPRNGVPIIFREVAPETLLLALKFGQETAPATVEYLFANISQRMAETMKEQIEELKPSSAKELETALTAFMIKLGTLEKDGAITLIKPEPAGEE